MAVTLAVSLNFIVVFTQHGAELKWPSK